MRCPIGRNSVWNPPYRFEGLETLDILHKNLGMLQYNRDCRIIFIIKHLKSTQITIATSRIPLITI